MEGGVTASRGGRLAVAALAAIAGVTVAWWAFALWPVPADGPEWLVRTRAVCFGVEPGGLPNAGGWVLLICQPLSMTAMLFIAWGGEVRAGLAQAWRSRPGRFVLGASSAAGVALFGLAGWRVQSALAERFDPRAGDANGSVTRLAVAPPPLALVDQRGDPLALARFAGRPVLVTFAYGHCATVCPVLVHDVLAARRAAGKSDAVVVIVTLDPRRDTPARLATIATEWRLGDSDFLAGGTVPEVEQVLAAWGVPYARDASTGEVAHASVVYLIAPDGRAAYRLDGGAGRAAALLRGL